MFSPKNWKGEALIMNKDVCFFKFSICFKDLTNHSTYEQSLSFGESFGFFSTFVRLRSPQKKKIQKTLTSLDLYFFGFVASWVQKKHAAN